MLIEVFIEVFKRFTHSLITMLKWIGARASFRRATTSRHTMSQRQDDVTSQHHDVHNAEDIPSSTESDFATPLVEEFLKNHDYADVRDYFLLMDFLRFAATVLDYVQNSSEDFHPTDPPSAYDQDDCETDECIEVFYEDDEESCYEAFSRTCRMSFLI